MRDQSWKWTVEIRELGDRQFVCVIEDGNVRIRGFDRLPDAESFAQLERQRISLPSVAAMRVAPELIA
jgi:hypothetical protein